MGAMLFRGKAAGVYEAGDHQSTFGGNPLACAAARVVLKTLKSPDFLAKVTQKGEFIRSTIKSWNLPNVKDVRGLGLMTGVQVEGDPVALEIACLDAGLLLATAGSDVLRIVPPLNISKKEIKAGLEILHQVLSK